jgi:hypothetical protein
MDADPPDCRGRLSRDGEFQPTEPVAVHRGSGNGTQGRFCTQRGRPEPSRGRVLEHRPWDGGRLGSRKGP